MISRLIQSFLKMCEEMQTYLSPNVVAMVKKFNSAATASFSPVVDVRKYFDDFAIQNKDDSWYGKCAEILGAFGEANKEFRPAPSEISWLSEPELFDSSSSNDNCLEALLIMTTVLERSLGNLFASVSSKPVPALLRDLVGSEELKSLISAQTYVLLQGLFHSPKSMNIRNLCWHGFILPNLYCVQ